MDCLIDTIGLTGCGASSPVSGLFINSLPGISLKSIESIADSEQQTYAGVWSDVQTRAAKRFKVAVTAALGKRYKMGALSASMKYKGDADTSSTTAGAAGYRGLSFDLDYPFDGTAVKRSALQNHYIQEAYYYHTGVGATVTIVVKDKDTLTTLYTTTLAATAGWNTKSINQSFTARRIFLAVECTTVTTTRTDLPNSANWKHECGVWVQGETLTGSTFTNTNQNTHGIGVLYSVRCSFDNVVCNNAELFYLPWWYCLGSELTLERKFTDRANKWTLNKAEADELKAFYDVEFEKSLAQVVDGINLDCDDVCIDCGSSYNIREFNAGC